MNELATITWGDLFRWLVVPIISVSGAGLVSVATWIARRAAAQSDKNASDISELRQQLQSTRDLGVTQETLQTVVKETVERVIADSRDSMRRHEEMERDRWKSHLAFAESEARGLQKQIDILTGMAKTFSDAVAKLWDQTQGKFDR